MSHAYLSPSSSYRAFNCPASVRRSDVVDKRAEMLREIGAEFYELDSDATVQFNAALEEDEESSSDGTALHKVFEDVLTAKADDEKTIRMLIDTSQASDKVKQDDELIAKFISVCQDVVSFCDTVDKRWVEKRVKVKGLPQFGTVDLATIKGRTLGVHDLKTGRNMVDAHNNYQLMCYAVGLLDELGWENFDTVTLEIIGVRFKSTSVFLNVKHIKKFKVDIMLPAFFDAYSINPTVKTGKWCQYCSAKLYCKEWLEKNNKAFDNVFMDDMSEKTNEELEELFYSFKDLEQLVNSQVKQELLIRFDTFNEPTGVTRVKGSQVVKWKLKPEEVEKALAEVVESDNLYKRSIKTPKQVEKLLGDRTDLMEDLTFETVKSPYLKKL